MSVCNRCCYSHRCLRFWRLVWPSTISLTRVQLTMRLRATIKVICNDSTSNSTRDVHYFWKFYWSINNSPGRVAVTAWKHTNLFHAATLFIRRVIAWFAVVAINRLNVCFALFFIVKNLIYFARSQIYFPIKKFKARGSMRLQKIIHQQQARSACSISPKFDGSTFFLWLFINHKCYVTDNLKV